MLWLQNNWAQLTIRGICTDEMVDDCHDYERGLLSILRAFIATNAFWCTRVLWKVLLPKRSTHLNLMAPCMVVMAWILEKSFSYFICFVYIVEIAVYSSEDRCIGEISLLSFIFLMIEARNQSQQHPRIIPCTHIFKVKKTGLHMETEMSKQIIALL